MKNTLLLNVIFLVILVSIVNIRWTERSTENQLDISGPITPIPPPIEDKVEPEKEPDSPEPNFSNYPPVRNVDNLGKVLSDIESHMPAGHIYKDNDKITWAHETVHGINSNMRMHFSKVRKTDTGEMVYLGEWIENEGIPLFKSRARINAFYVLEDRAMVLKEPDTTIQQVAKVVPQSLRGGVYQLYMINQAQSWGDTPLYIFDEWVAYTAGSEARLDLDIKERSESVLYMLEFNVYAICLAMASQTDDSDIKDFMRWNAERAMKVYVDSKEKLGNASSHDEYLEKMRTATDAEEFRTFARAYLGEAWCERILGF